MAINFNSAFQETVGVVVRNPDSALSFERGSGRDTACSRLRFRSLPCAFVDRSSVAGRLICKSVMMSLVSPDSVLGGGGAGVCLGTPFFVANGLAWFADAYQNKTKNK